MHVQNATLAGGVAIGTTATMIIQPWGAVLIGLVSGALSTMGYKYVQVSCNTNTDYKRDVISSLTYSSLKVLK